MKKRPYLIISNETGKEYRRKALKQRYDNIKTGQIYRVYEIRRNVGYISNNTVYKTTKEK
jgi:hypothetical protein